MNITIFGTGYVGLVTGACLADVGHTVMCVDINEDKIQKLSQGIIPIFEPGLDDLVNKNTGSGRLKFTVDAAEGVNFGDLIFIAVGTPPEENGSADLNHVLAVAQSIGKHITEYKVIANKSTVPVGTADKVSEIIRSVLAQRNKMVNFDVCSNPEFLKEGAAIEDFTRAPRIVVGTESDQVRRRMRECYAPYNRNHNKIMFMDVRSAELTKYAANAMLATKISFMNEISTLAEVLGADIEQVRQGIGSDPRIGYDFIYPGCGYGGSCFPKDVMALLRTGQSAGIPMPLIDAVDRVNTNQKRKLFEKLNYALNGELQGKTIAVWGLSFKPDTDDMREAPSRTLMEELWNHGVTVQAYDPVAVHEAKRIYGLRADLKLMATANDALMNADALVICTEWKEFRAVDFAEIKKRLSAPIIVDGRNLFQPSTLSVHGLRYFSIGRSNPL